MFKKFATVLLAVLVIASISFAQSTVVKNGKTPDKYKSEAVAISAGDNLSTKSDDRTRVLYDEPVVDPLSEFGDLVVTTQYGVQANDCLRNNVVIGDDGYPHFTLMVFPSTIANRAVTYLYGDGTNYILGPNVVDARKGWPTIDYPRSGALAGAGVYGIVAHTPNALYLWDGFAFSATEFEANTDPSIAFAGDKIFTVTSGNRLVPTFHVSEDYGISFTQWGTSEDFQDQIGTITGDADDGMIELDIQKSPDEMYIGILGSNTNDGGIPFIAEGAEPSNMYLITSNDQGATWDAQIILEAGDLDAVEFYPYTLYVDSVTVTLPDGSNETVFVGQDIPVDYAPGLTASFISTGALAVDNNGVFHVALSGFGWIITEPFDVVTSAGTQTVTTFDFFSPVIYWNSASKAGWKIVSTKFEDNRLDAFIHNYPDANGFNRALGNQWPGVAVSEDGEVVYICWTGPQFDAAGELEYLGNEEYYTDNYHVYSIDGGATFGDVAKFASKSDFGEWMANPYRLLEKVDDNTYKAHLTYYAGPPAFAITAPTADSPFYEFRYKAVELSLVGVDDQAGQISNYELSQNYPNPFNPTTEISYSVPEATNVSLVVYDMLGREVATLVNREAHAAGSYKVKFDASNLASGMYLYKLTAGDFTSSKKMMLLK